MRPFKYLFLFLLVSAISCKGVAQKKRFDVLAYTQPAGWEKTESANSVIFTKQKGNDFAMVTFYKSLVAENDPQKNFDLSWESLVHKILQAGTPTMQAGSNENGWNIKTGTAQFDNEGAKAVAMLMTGTSGNRMVNILCVFNSDAFQKELENFLATIEPQKQTATAQNNNANQASSTNAVNGSGSKNFYSITVPPTWSLNAGTNTLTLEKNTATGKRIVEFMDMVRSSGSLEKDMEHIFFEVFDGWNLYNSPNNLLFENGTHEKGFTSQGLPYYMLSNSITKKGGDVITGTVLLIQVGTNVAIINSADQILGSESGMALNFLLFTLKINGATEKYIDYKSQLIGTWGSSSGTYGNSLNAVTNYTAEGKCYVLIQSSYTVGYDYYNDLIKKKQFNSEGVFAFKGNVLERKTSSGTTSKYFIRFYATKYGTYEWRNLMAMYNYNYDKNKIETLIPFQKL